MPKIYDHNDDKSNKRSLFLASCKVKGLQASQLMDVAAFIFKNLHAVQSQDLMRDPQASGRLRRRSEYIAWQHAQA